MGGDAMTKLRAFFRNRWARVGVVVVLMAVIATTFALIFVNNGDHMTIRALAGSDIEQRRPRDYRHSRMWLNSNGTFAIEIILTEDNVNRPILVAIGTHRRVGGYHELTFIDYYRFDGEIFRREDSLSTRVDPYNPDATQNFRRVGGRFEFICPNHRIYFFR